MGISNKHRKTATSIADSPAIHFAPALNPQQKYKSTKVEFISNPSQNVCRYGVRPLFEQYTPTTFSVQQQNQQQQQQQLLGSESIHASNGNGSIQNTNGGVEQEDTITSCYSGQVIIDIDGTTASSQSVNLSIV